MTKSVGDVNEERRIKYNTKNNKFDDFPVGTKVQIVCVCQDFNFFDGTEKGVVIRNSGQYLGIIVKFDEPRHFEGGHIQTEFNFAPDDLTKLEDKMEIVERLKSLGFNRLADSFSNKKEVKGKMKVAYRTYPHLTQEKINVFNKKLEKKRLRVNFYSVSSYENGIPSTEVLDKLEEAKKLGCFDSFEIAKVEEIKDPILFGRISGCPDYFFIAQWGEDIKIEDILMEDIEDVKVEEHK